MTNRIEKPVDQKTEAEIFAAAQALLDTMRFIDRGDHLMLQVSNDTWIDGEPVTDTDIDSVLSTLED